MNADKIIKRLNLEPHPEGGYFRRTYASEFLTNESEIKNRPLTTMIYYLLKSGQKSRFHKLKSDEIWLFHEGSDISIHTIDILGNYTTLKVGNSIDSYLQVIVPANTWFAAEIDIKNSYSLCSCVVNPGFDFKEFELADRNTLTSLFPEHKELITEFT